MIKSSILPTEVILSNSRQSLGHIYLDWVPYPGNYLNLHGQTYAVLERRHHYQLYFGRYCLNKMTVYVQLTQPPSELNLISHRWIVGDTSCRFNAHSELIRCAVNPTGPCRDCSFYEATVKT